MKNIQCKSIDLTFLCANLGNLSAMPVRLFDNKEQVFYSSIVSLPSDPLAPYLGKVFEIKEHVGYFIAPHDYYYGVVNFKEKKIVIGPTRQVPISDQELKELAFETGVHHAETDDFIKGMKSLVQMPLTAIIQMLSIVNHVVNDGEKLSLTDVAIHDFEQEKMTNVLAEEEASRLIENADIPDERNYPHNAMGVEEYLLGAVRRGDVIGLKNYFQNVPAVRSGVMAQSELRQAKNLLVVTATLVSREAIRGGMDPDEALTLSDAYIQKNELLQSSIAVTNLNYRLIMDFTEKMDRLHYGGKSSPLVRDVINYVRHHLSEPITVEALARHLLRGRSRLSTDFKKETGENLSDFILKQKTEEAKRLLRYTDKPAVDIALYLGFSSQSHFSRTFKKYVSMTPNEYRTTRATRR